MSVILQDTFKVLSVEKECLSKQCRLRSDCSKKEQSDQGQQCLPFNLHLLDTLLIL